MNHKQIIKALEQCRNSDERLVMVAMLSTMEGDCVTPVHECNGRLRRYHIGNKFSGFDVYEFKHDGRKYVYSPVTGADGCGYWACDDEGDE